MSAAMTDREKARDLGNKSAELARSIADVLNDTLDSLAACEASLAGTQHVRDDYKARLEAANAALREIERMDTRETVNGKYRLITPAARIASAYFAREHIGRGAVVRVGPTRASDAA